MEYTINALAKMSGISSRTLRHYDDIDLLKPSRISSTRYRIYGQKEIDKLQQILFYKELGLGLSDIKEILNNSNFDPLIAMEKHLLELEKKRKQINKLIVNVNKTIKSIKGEVKMSNKEKFEGFKQNMIEENEQKYGQEIREKYGEEMIEESNKKLAGMTQEEYQEIEKLTLELNNKLKEAVATGNPGGDLAQEVCELHKKWLTFYWPKNTYTKEAHQGLAQMYCQDERFKEYYEKIAPGTAEFLYEAIKIYCQ